MSINNLSVGRIRRRLGFLGSISLALAFGWLLIATPASAHPSVVSQADEETIYNAVSSINSAGEENVAGAMLQLYSPESDKHVIHAHFHEIYHIDDGDPRWEIYSRKSFTRDCSSSIYSTRYEEVSESDFADRFKIKPEYMGTVGGFSIPILSGLIITLDSSDNNREFCLRYTADHTPAAGEDIRWNQIDGGGRYKQLRVDLTPPVVTLAKAENNQMEVTFKGVKGSVVHPALGVDERSADDPGIAARSEMKVRYSVRDVATCTRASLDGYTSTSQDTSELINTEQEVFGAGIDAFWEKQGTANNGINMNTWVHPDNREAQKEHDDAVAKRSFSFNVDVTYVNDGKYLCIELSDEKGNAGYAVRKINVGFPLTLRQVPETTTTGKVVAESIDPDTKKPVPGVQFSYRSNPALYQADGVGGFEEPAASKIPIANTCAARFVATGTSSLDVFRDTVPGGGYEYDADTDYICIIARNSDGNRIRVAFEIDKTSPEITDPIQSNQYIDVIGSDPEGDTTLEEGVDAVFSDAGRINDWEARYVVATGEDPDPDSAVELACSAENFRGRSPEEGFATYTFPSKAVTAGLRGATIDLSASSSGYNADRHGICFKLSDVSGRAVYAGIVIADFTPTPTPRGGMERPFHSPYISLSLEGGSVSGTPQWSWFELNSLADSCNADDADDFEDSESSSEATITAEAGVAAYCVRATVGDNNYYALVVGPGSETLDTTAPSVTITIDADTNMVSASATDSGTGVDPNSWQYAILADADFARDNCNVDPVQAIVNWKSGDSFKLNASQGDQYVCFEASDMVGNLGYAHMVLPVVEDNNPPTLTVTQSGNTLNWNAQDDTGIASYEYQSFTNLPTDCMFDSGWVEGQKAALAETDNDSHYCFRVKDHADNYAYSGPLTIANVDTTPPTITVSQSGNTVSAIPGELGTSGWQFFRSDDEPTDCSSRYTGWGDVKVVEAGRRLEGLTAADSTKWICFRVMDAAGNYGYKKFQIETITEEDEMARTASDGNLEFNLEGRRLMVNLAPAEDETETPAVISWNYLFYGSEASARANCSADSNQFEAVAPGTANEFNVRTSDSRGQAYVHLGKWFCFRAIDENNQEAFGVFQVPATLSDGTTTTQPQQPTTTPDPADDDDPTPDPADTTPPTTTPDDDDDDVTPSDDDDDDDATPSDDSDDSDDTTTPTEDSDDSDDPADPEEEEESSSAVVWYIVGAVVVLVLIVVFVAMGSKGKSRE